MNTEWWSTTISRLGVISIVIVVILIMATNSTPYDYRNKCHKILGNSSYININSKNVEEGYFECCIDSYINHYKWGQTCVAVSKQ